MKKVIDFKTRYNNLAKEVKILTGHKKASKEQKSKYFIELTNKYIITYSYLNEITFPQEYKKYLEKLYILRDIITAYGLERD